MSASRNFSYLVDAAQEVLHVSGNNDFGQLSIPQVNQDAIEDESESDPGPENYGTWGILDQTQAYFSTLGEKIIKVATGVKHAVMLTDRGNVYTTGSNRQGQLGTGGSANVSFNNIQVLGGSLSKSVANIWANGYYTIIQDRNGNIHSFGANESGQLIRDNGGQNAPRPKITAIADPKHVACGYFHTVFINTTNRLLGCGYNRYGQIGSAYITGTAEYNPTPVVIDTNVVHADCGASHTVWIKDDNTVWGMGHNYYGQIAPFDASYGTNTPVSTPIQMTWGPLDPALSDQPAPVSVHCGTSHTIIRFADGQVWGLGYNHWGQLGVESDLAIPSTGIVDVVIPKLITDGVESLDTCATHSLFAKRNESGFIEFFGAGENRSSALFRDPAVVQTVNSLLDVAISGEAILDESILFNITYATSINPKYKPTSAVIGTKNNLLVNSNQLSVTGKDTLDLISQAPTTQNFNTLTNTNLPVSTSDFFALSVRMRVDALSQMTSTTNSIVEMSNDVDNSFFRMAIDNTGLVVTLSINGAEYTYNMPITVGSWIKLTARVEYGQMKIIEDNLENNTTNVLLTMSEYLTNLSGYTGNIGTVIDFWTRDALAYTASVSRVDIYS